MLISFGNKRLLDDQKVGPNKNSTENSKEIITTFNVMVKVSSDTL